MVIKSANSTATSIYFLKLYFNHSILPRIEYQGMIDRLLITFKNSLHHRNLYQRILKQNAFLEKTLSIRDEFISIASHELRTPITSIQLQLQLLNKVLEKSPKTPLDNLSKHLKITDQEVDRLTRLIVGLFDVSKIQSGKLSLEIVKTDLSSLTQDLIFRVLDQLKLSKTHLILNITPEVIGYWDPFRLEQVINNLVNNAIKYGEGKPIEIHLSKSETNAIITVRDQGIGISEDQQEIIFEKFTSAANASKATGLGLGLYISRQIIHQHSGSIRVKSRLHEGSTFTVTLPIKKGTI